MGRPNDPDPATGFRFSVSFGTSQGDYDIGSFTSCEGLGAEYEIFEYQEGGENGYVHRIPGRLKFTPIKLSRPVDAKSGSSASSGLAAWFSDLKNHVRRTTAAITAFDARGNQIAQWNLVGVYPSRWTGPSLAADGNSVPKETLELAHDGFIK
jgi:phage tail-like protein